MATSKELRTKISLDSAQFQQSMAGVNRQLKGLKEESKAVTSAGNGFARGLTELRSKSDVLTRTLEVQQAKVNELRKRYEETERKTGEHSKATQNANVQYQKAQAELQKTQNQLKGVTTEIERQTNPWNQLSKSMDNTGKKLQNAGRNMTDFGKTMSMSVTAPIVGMGALMVRTGMDFEKSMSNVQAVSGATGNDFELLEKKAREMGAQTTKSASQAADGLGYMALAGWETEEMLQGIEPMLRLSEAANIDLGRASDLVTDSMSALQIEVKDLPKYLDNVAQSARKSNTNIDTLMEAYIVAGGNLAQFNVPLEESSALLGLLANRGLKGSEAGRALNAIMVNLTSGVGQAGTAMDELNISAFDANGNFIGFEETLRLVKDRTKDMTDEQKAQYISMIAGKEHLKSFQGLLTGLDSEYKELKGSITESDGALNDMADTMQDNAMGNVAKLKSAFEELSIQATEHILPAFTGIVDKATELTEWFGELDKDTQKNIISMAGFAAVIGPAAIVTGNLTTAIGGVFQIGSKLTGLLGRAGGAGLLGRIAGFGVGGPVGLAIGGLSLLLPLLANVKAEKQKLHEVNWDNIESMKNEIVEIDKLIDRFGQLQTKNQLTTDEMLRFMDIMDQLKQTDNPQTIKALTDEQQKLLEKSGLTNDEMSEFLRLNDEVIDKAPDTKKAISDEGNAFAENLSILQQLNAEKREELLMNAERELEKTLENEAQLLKDQKTYVSEIKDLDKQINDNRKERLTVAADLNAQEVIQRDIDNEIKTLKGEIKNLDGDALIKAQSKLEWLKLQKAEQDSIVEGLEMEKNKLIETGDKLAEKLKKKNKDLDLTREELKELDTMKWDYEQLILAQANINSEKGKGISAIDRAIAKEQAKKEELKKQYGEQGKLSAEYQEQIGKIDSQIGKLQDAKGNLRDMNKLAGETIYKDINISEKPSIDSIHRRLTSPVSKVMNIITSGGGYHVEPGYKDGTNFHPGGRFIAGEEGFELGRMGNNWEMLNLGRYSRPAGYQVFTHDESKKIISALNNMPAYATGSRPSGEANRVVNQLNNNQSKPSIYQTNQYYSTAPLSPSEVSRKNKQMLQRAAMEWR